MTIVLIVVAAAWMFVVARVGGELLARHYNDLLEVLGVLLLAGSLLGPAGLLHLTDVPLDAAPVTVLALAFSTGLFSGYWRGSATARRG